MSQTFEELEAEYIAALNRVSSANSRLREVAGDPKPLGSGQPPVVAKAERDAQNEAQQAWNTFVPIRERYWSTRWGREGNPLQS
ncbi:hypothetical protein [Streptomyces sp. NPDC005231]|uniref:hypothetical protein n=1 Tax=Streptomyces sp. NPDC005231 TaxID=3157026 RepID=UPI0033AFF9CA